ncbi:monothiol glutaredoxin-S15, mitochondrial isoform X1 [Eucalyptus grandis]|uniref:monothiol glutaredoxin-S15, mitochondrial isoform X1 n=1 Tax=Eucalyptus grandis TaxID=71139 RepID=UPI00192ED23B|nr:monothiol glutaredoxin-S15, mitochondrial isoform X1 [Eucalyptus grandis]
MARALSNHLLKGITGSPAGCSNRMVSALSIQRGMRYSTTVPNDPDTHDDFKPMDKFQDSTTSLKDVVEQDVKENPVMIYMKGVPEFPQCGFSSLAVRVLKHYNVPLSARNILENAELKSAVKAFSHWPTFPQIFIKGEFIGGSDIILKWRAKGEDQGYCSQPGKVCLSNTWLIREKRKFGVGLVFLQPLPFF